MEFMNFLNALMEEQSSSPTDPPKMPNFFEVDKKKWNQNHNSDGEKNRETRPIGIEIERGTKIRIKNATIIGMRYSTYIIRIESGTGIESGSEIGSRPGSGIKARPDVIGIESDTSWHQGQNPDRNGRDVDTTTGTARAGGTYKRTRIAGCNPRVWAGGGADGNCRRNAAFVGGGSAPPPARRPRLRFPDSYIA
ncbi:hypothetical protein EVAR_7984_1 [Eumeta japonica]|uniref:Uncharacterized protein n=1 Tax=Eumeta variegata TaxID=151549 RepID=A0A4C1TKC9_EUMVA|nr:hypothetical protein EVAR_7984_1 [Eumeta japonica]